MTSLNITALTNDDDFLKAAYLTILGRQADEEGFLHYSKQLRGGTPRVRILLELMTSPEAKFRGFDSSEIESAVQYYRKKKDSIPIALLDHQLRRNHAERIISFFYHLRANLLNSPPSFNTTTPHPAPHNTAKTEDESEIYDSYRQSALTHLERLYSQRANANDETLSSVLGVHVPRWIGITNATKALFPYTFPVPLSPDVAPEQLPAPAITAIIDVLADAEFEQLVFSGGDYFQCTIAEEIKRKSPAKRIKVIWHGSPRQLGPQYELDPFLAWIALARRGICEAIASVKPGMTSLFDTLNLRSHFIQNTAQTSNAIAPAGERPNSVGMWLSHVGSYNKPVSPTLFALSGIPHLTLQGSGFGEDGLRLIRRLEIRHTNIHPYTIPHTKVIQGIRSSKLTIYITLSECMPMVPFESISEGTLCLVGPSTRLYDDPTLEHNLVVKNPFSSAEIASKIETALSKQGHLLELSQAFLLRSRERSRNGLMAFLQ